ncbi:MAG: HPr kinase/phosphorylase [Hyphomicrobiales bacterium]
MSAPPKAGGAAPAAVNLHGTCVALGGRAALLRGRPGSLKSDLALRFLSAFKAEGAGLVADDQVLVRLVDGVLLARCPQALSGRLEVRGLGIVEVASAGEAPLALLVDLVPSQDVPRMPPEPAPAEEVCGVALPVVRLDPREASAPVKLRLALTGAL